MFNKFIYPLLFKCLIFLLLIISVTACSHKQRQSFKEEKVKQLPKTTKIATTNIKIIPTIINITPNNIVLSPGDSFQLTVKAIMNDKSTKDITSTTSNTTYKSSNPDIVIINNNGVLQVSDKAKTGEQVMITSINNNCTAHMNITIKYSLKDTLVINDEGKAVITNYTDTTVLVNKKRNLPSDYIPADLVKPNIPFSFSGENEKRYLRKEAAKALESLLAQAKEDHIDIVGVSGYRSYKRQQTIFNWNVQKKGFKEANKVSAQPGQSEHQTGLAIDMSCKSVGYNLVERFGESKEGLWLKENAPKYGFIIRYPKEKESVTGYCYEPWHIRYVGVNIAKKIYKNNITLEEYFESK